MNKQKLPGGWKEIELSEVFDFQKKSRIKAGEGLKKGEYKFFTSSDKQTKFIDQYNQYNQDGEYLIFATGGHAGIHYCNEKFSTSTDCFIVKVDKKVLAKYVYYYLFGKIQLLEEGFKGAGLKHISKGYIQDIKLFYPENKETQKAIVSILEKAEKAKEWRKEADNLTQDFLESTFFEMFGNPINNDKNWIKCNLSKYGLLARGKSAHRPRNAKFLYGGKYPFIQTGDVRQSDSIYLKKYTQTYSEEGIKQSKLFYRGTLAITIAANIGETAVLAFDSYFPDSVVGFKVESPLFMSYLLKCYKPLLDSLATNTAQKNINLAILNNLEVIDIPIALQNKFASIVQEVEKLKQHQKRSNQEINNLFNALMQKAFKGELKC